MKRLKVIRMYKSCNWGGGVHTRLAELLPRLAEHADVRLLCYRKRGDRADELESAGVPVDVIPLGAKWAPWNVARYVRYFQQHRPDVVHTHEYTANTIGVVAARRAAVPVVLRHLHTMAPWGWGGAARLQRRIRADARAAGRSQLTLAVSEAVRRTYLAHTNVPAASCRVLYNGIDLGRFEGCQGERGRIRSELGIAADAPLVGVVGRLSRGKGMREFLQASRHIAQRVADARFLVVGSGGLQEELEALAGELDIAGKVVFTGRRADVPALLGALDLFLFPSMPDAEGRVQDGHPGVVLEAMAAGLPVVSFALPMMAEVIEEGATGCLVPVGDVDRLAGEAVALLENRALRQRMGSTAAAAVTRFGLEACVESTLGIYRELSNPARGPEKTANVPDG